jgi:hypothetical protein
VPYQYVQKPVEICFSPTVVEILHGGKRIASHLRTWGKHPVYKTLEEHMPRAHQEYLKWTPERMSDWAGKAGPATRAVSDAIMKSKPHPQQAFKAVLGLIRQGEKHTNERLEKACKKALELRSPSYSTVKSMLAAALEDTTFSAAVDQKIEHENIRGSDYFQ